MPISYLGFTQMKVYDIQKMQELLHDFYNLTGIKMCIYDSEEHELCFYPEKLTPFCRALREDGAMDEQCRACDRRAFAACKATHRRTAYTCHAGLIECFSPILYEDKIVGYIVIGQIRPRERPFAGTDARLAALYERLPTVAEDKIDSAIHILDACAGYEYLKALVSDYDRRIDARLQARIDAGMLDEVAELRANGATDEFLEGLGLEYRYILRYLTGQIPTLDGLKDELGRAIKRFAKRQMVWFKKDRDVLWLDTAGDPLAQAVAAADAFLAE